MDVQDTIKRIFFKKDDGTIGYPITTGDAVIDLDRNEDYAELKDKVESLKNIDVETDKTLSKENKPADAKTTGELLVKLSNDIEDLKYKAIEISSFTNSINTAELGTTISSITLNWKINKTPTLLTLDNEQLEPTDESKILTNILITNNKTWTLKATDNKNVVVQKTTTLNFYNGVYYGASEELDYDNNFILKLTKVLSGSKSRTFSANAGTNQYIYYCLPSRLGIPSFNVNGFDGGFLKVSTISFTNASNYTENYDIYKSENSNLGNTTVKVV